MGITLDTPTTGGPPAVKFPSVGDSVVVGIVNVTEYQQHNIDGVPQTWSDGGPKMGKRVTGLVVAAEGAVIGGEAGDQPVGAGELVTFYCEKSKHYTWRDAVAAHGTVEVGDVMKWTFDREEPPSQRGYNPRKVYTAAIRKPKPDDGDLVQRCVAEHQAMADRPTVDAGAPTATPAPAPANDDPFGDF